MSVVKKGIKLHLEYDFSKQNGFPSPQSILTCQDYMLVKFFDFDQPLLLKAAGNSWEGLDSPKHLASKDLMVAFFQLSAVSNGKPTPNLI